MSKTKTTQPQPQLAETDLPEGWACPLVRDLLDVRYGKGLPEKNRKDGPYAVYGSNGVVGQHNEALTAGPTIIVGRKGTVGAVHYSRQPCWPIDTTYFIPKVPGLDMGFLYYALKTLGLPEMDTSSAIPGLNRQDVFAQALPLAPLPEQKRIVAKVEALLERVSAARKRLAKLPVILKRFRQSVLTSACSGHLTRDWRKSLKETKPVESTIKEILSLHEKEWGQNSVFKHYRPPMKVEENGLPELPPGWRYVYSDLLFSFVTSGSRGWAKYYSQTGPKFIRIGNLDHDSISLDLNHVEYVTPPNGYEQKRTRIHQGDILISITADVGMIGLVEKSIGEGYVNQHIAIARPVSCVFAPYLAWYLTARDGGQKQFQGLQRGATKIGLGLDDIRSIIIPYPPIEEQIEIVRRVKQLFLLADSITERVKAATSRVDYLAAAILAKAFRGDLVLTEAELAGREGRSYEPASALLARIKLEQEGKARPERVAGFKKVRNQNKKRVNCGTSKPH